MKEIEVTRITATFGGKGSIGGFQNAERNITVEASVPAGVPYEIAEEVVFGMARRAVARQWREIVRQQMDMDSVVSAHWRSKDEDIRDYVEGRGAFEYFALIDPAMAETFVQQMIAEVTERRANLAEERAAAIAAAETDDDDSEDDDTWDDSGDDDDEPDYTGDGFTEEHDDGYAADADPDEVEYEKARTTYPDAPPYAEAMEEELPFAAEGEDGEPAH